MSGFVASGNVLPVVHTWVVMLRQATVFWVRSADFFVTDDRGGGAVLIRAAYF
jgi:hypothetical protein